MFFVKFYANIVMPNQNGNQKRPMERNSHQFYKNLLPISQFADLAKSEVYTPAPEDWSVVITDVVGSTKAIEEGRYKDVNVAGAIASMAVANLYKDFEYPFIFGGDGITYLIPNDFLSEVIEIMIDTRNLVQTTFNLDLRIGVVPIRDIYEKGYKLLVAKVKMSKYYNQANIAGDGLEWAEAQIKSKENSNSYLVEKRTANKQADYSGFTCRWQDVPSHRGETLALIVKIRSQKEEEQEYFLKIILNKIKEIFGAEQDYNPIQEKNIQPTSSPDDLFREAAIQSRKTNGWKFWREKLKIITQIKLLNFIIDNDLPIVKISDYPAKEVKKAQVLAADFKKYDGTLKMVLAATTEQRINFDNFLKELYEQGNIFYGIHTSNRALMTCMLHEGSTQEVHFVDAADGGYALAAKQLKNQIKKEK